VGAKEIGERLAGNNGGVGEVTEGTLEVELTQIEGKCVDAVKNTHSKIKELLLGLCSELHVSLLVIIHLLVEGGPVEGVELILRMSSHVLLPNLRLVLYLIGCSSNKDGNELAGAEGLLITGELLEGEEVLLEINSFITEELIKIGVDSFHQLIIILLNRITHIGLELIEIHEQCLAELLALTLPQLEQIVVTLLPGGHLC
jgi:hypothetical protein